MTRETLSKIALAAFALLLSFVVGSRSISIVFAYDNPEQALSAWHGNGDARARQSDILFRREYAAVQQAGVTEATQFDEALSTARMALADQALNPRALRVIALSLDVSQDQKLQMIVPVGELTRRDTLTQLFLIQNAAQSEDLSIAMKHYDALLRRETAARDVAGRMLAQAMSDPQMAREVTGLLRSDPSWKSLLFYYLMEDRDNWPSFVGIHRDLAGTDLISLETTLLFVERLSEAGEFGYASEVARLVGYEPLSSVAQLIDTEFEASSAFPGSWSVRDKSMASLQTLSEGGAVLNLGRGAAGVLARRLVALSPGIYQTQIEYEPMLGGDAKSELEVRLTCARTQESIWGPNGYQVDEQCPYQWLSIYAERGLQADQQLILNMVAVANNG